MKKDILFLSPVFTHNIWGGTGLRENFGYEIEGDDIGECWGIAAHENGDCLVNGEKKLSEVYREHPDWFGNIDSDRFPLLIKIIDAKDDLSIQVHPDDAYAKEHENGSFGKTECWYILSAPEGATLVAGHNAKTQEELREMVREGKFRELIREIPVSVGDFIQIDPGTVHAIKGGLTLLETQQNSDITYRLYDYDRLQNGKPRELHLEKSMDVITVPAKDPEEQVKRAEDIEREKKPNSLCPLHECGKYTVYLLDVEGTASFPQDKNFLCMSVFEGEGKLNGHSVKKGDHLILPCGYGEVTIEGMLRAICSTV